MSNTILPPADSAASEANACSLSVLDVVISDETVVSTAVDTWRTAKEKGDRCTQREHNTMRIMAALTIVNASLYIVGWRSIRKLLLQLHKEAGDSW